MLKEIFLVFALLCLLANTANASVGPCIDIPEPATIALLGLGAMILLPRKRR